MKRQLCKDESENIIRACLASRSQVSSSSSSTTSSKRSVCRDFRPVHEHYVVVGGRRFPPKQVLSCVTGLDRADFTTHQARRILKRLGFVAARAGDAEVPVEDPAVGVRTADGRPRRSRPSSASGSRWPGRPRCSSRPRPLRRCSPGSLAMSAAPPTACFGCRPPPMRRRASRPREVRVRRAARRCVASPSTRRARAGRGSRLRAASSTSSIRARRPTASVPGSPRSSESTWPACRPPHSPSVGCVRRPAPPAPT